MLKLRRLLSLFLVNYFIISLCYAEPIDYSKEVLFNIVKVKKRNLAGCKRLGNVYGWCEWVAFVKINNKLDKPLQYACTNLLINNKKYEVCLGKNSKKSVVKANDFKIFLLNLNKLINYPNKNDRPKILLTSLVVKL